MEDIILKIMCVVTPVLYGIAGILYGIAGILSFKVSYYVLGSVNLIACIYWVWFIYTI